jgi:hypothetical protein
MKCYHFLFPSYFVNKYLDLYLIYGLLEKKNLKMNKT